MVRCGEVGSDIPLGTVMLRLVRCMLWGAEVGLAEEKEDEVDSYAV